MKFRLKLYLRNCCPVCNSCCHGELYLLWLLCVGWGIYSWSFPKLWRDPFLRQDLTVHFSQIERDPWLWSYSCRHRPLERTRLDFVVIWFSERRDSVNISLDKCSFPIICTDLLWAVNAFRDVNPLLSVVLLSWCPGVSLYHMTPVNWDSLAAE